MAETKKMGNSILRNEPSFEEWAIKELATPYYGHVSGDSAKALTLPKYQRNFVWTDKKRKELINSVLNGFPIGTLIVRKTDVSTRIPRSTSGFVEAETYELLDGLQRSTTLLLNRLNFLELISGSDVVDVFKSLELDLNRITSVLESLNASMAKKGLAEVIAEWMRSCHTIRKFSPDSDSKSEYKVAVFDAPEFQTGQLVIAIAKEYEISSSELQDALQAENLWSPLLRLPEATKSLFDISEKVIPVIVWEGDDKGAASIFERVNQGGVKLNRYQALAASWYSSQTDITSGHTLGRLANEALSTKVAGAIVEKRGRKSENLDLYEALVGLSEALASRHPHLFPPAKKPSLTATELSPIEKPGVNYYAFNIVALVTGLKISDIADLRNELTAADGSTDLKVSSLFDLISQASNKVAEALKSLSYANSENNVGHTEAGMASMVAGIAIHLRDGGKLPTISESNIRRHYVVDLIRGLDAKGHASDLAAFERLWDVVDGQKRATDYYVKPCAANSYENALDAFWKKELERTISPSQMRRPKIDNVQKAILRLFLSQTGVFAAITRSDTHHVDHVVPFMRGKDWIKADNGTLPIGAISNLAFLPEKLNLSKGSNTLDEWFSWNPKGSEKSIKQQILDSHSKEQIWSLVPALEGETKDLTRLIGPRNVEEQFINLQERIWSRMRAALLRL